MKIVRTSLWASTVVLAIVALGFGAVSVLHLGRFTIDSEDYCFASMPPLSDPEEGIVFLAKADITHFPLEVTCARNEAPASTWVVVDPQGWIEYAALSLAIATGVLAVGATVFHVRLAVRDDLILESAER